MFLVRSLEQKDLLDAEELYVKSVRLNRQGFWQNIEDFKNIKDFILDTQKAGGNFYGIFVDNKIIALGGYINEGEKKGQICKLHLNKDYQGLGLGRLLLSAIEADAKKNAYKELVLHVTETQTSAISLYKKMGYEVAFVNPLENKLEEGVFHTFSVHMGKKIN